MVGTSAGILARPSAEFRESHCKDLILKVMSLEIFLEGGHCGREFL